jgi:pimeloyl-ACP methyl ester carboxylesterase
MVTTRGVPVATTTARTAPTPSFLLLHGAATTGAIWAGVRRELGERPTLAPDRPSTGDLDLELAALADAVEAAATRWATPLPPRPGPAAAPSARPRDAPADGTRRPVVFGGVSGGATLGLAALAAGVPLAATVLHEPAVGSLLPGLLAPMAAAYASGGVAGFGGALYGPSWRPAVAPADPGAVARDLAMFLRFEPAAPKATPGPVLVTVGERSPEVRHRAAAALHRELGVRIRVLPGCGHAVHLEAPEQFARVLTEVAAALG